MMLLFCLLIAASPPPPREAVAIVVTNNRSLELGRPELRYADDDGVQYAMLFGERLGASHVFLLSELDRDSERLYPDAARTALPPTRAMLAETLQRAAKILSDARARGADTDAYVVFAGHGDIDNGRGFIELQDARFSADDLEALLDTLAPRQNAHAFAHVVLDSCNSYFMLNPRKAGGLRYGATAPVNNAFFDRHPNIGAIISTSAEAETYEWSELQSGIFSYVLRSGLRGAGDADGDTRLTYRELEAFSNVATDSVINEKFRPRVYTHAPKNDRSRTFWTMPQNANATRIQKPRGNAYRITVRDERGVRLLDMHADADTALQLVLPMSAVRFDITEHTTTRPLMHHVARGETLVLGVQPGDGSTPPLATRGDSRVFEALFKDAYGTPAIDRYEASRPAAEEETFGLSLRDIERFEQTLNIFVDNTSTERRHDGFLNLAVAAAAATTGFAGLGVGLFGPAPSRPFGLVLATASAPLAVASGIASAISFARKPAEERIALRLRQAHGLSLRTRANATLAAEAELGESVAVLRKARISSGKWNTVVGAITIVTAASLIVLGQTAFGLGSDWLYLSFHAAILSAGALMLTTGILKLTILRTPQERMWDLYQASGALTPLGLPPIQRINVTPFVSPVSKGAFSLGLSAGFAF